MKILKEMMSSTDMSLNEIGAKYCVSYSVLRRIRQWSEAQIEDLNIRKINWIYGSKKEAVIKLIKEYLHNHSHTITAKEVTFHINQKLQNNFGVDFIRKVMKHHLRLSFKRVKPRPNSINLEKVGSIRKLFAFKFSKLISEDTLIVNIDESSINRRVSTNYTWGIKGFPIECRNSPFAGSVSLVMAICSNGAWISFFINETIDSQHFIWFLKILNQWLDSNNNFGYSKVILMLDNWSFHKSSLSKRLLLKLWYTIVYLPAYSPNFAPIEMWFSMIKKSLSELCKRETINLFLKNNFTKIYSSLITIKCITIKRLFWNLYRSIREYL